MTSLKCKMCGGTIEFAPGSTVGICDSCGTKQTLPKTNSEALSNLFNRANNLRLKCEFDKAEQIYEKIVEQDDSEAEAHWGIVLCKYGIEYVEDPKTLERIPTCHRTLYEPITSDVDYLATIDYSDALQQVIYEKEARAIDRIQKGILEIVRNEKPFDVFICYKETDENGKRTVDSAIANDIYYQLTQEGLKVFYAPITLEDKVGQEYEPYIFAALNSAKVMLVIGTKPEYFSAVWVKNEWSRFMKLMKTNRSKLLIPCYRDMDAYDLPEEFAHLQAQDMGKIGFINDVVRGIRKVVAPDIGKTPVLDVVTSVAAGIVPITPLLKRAFMFLEDGEWDKADDFCEQVLNQDPENAQAYLGKLMAELHVRRQEDLSNYDEPFDEKNSYLKALRFGEPELQKALTSAITKINERNNINRLEESYSIALNAMNEARSEEAFKKAAAEFNAILGYKDSSELHKRCLELAEDAKRDAVYASALERMNDSSRSDYEAAIKILKTIPGWKDSDQQIQICIDKIEELTEKEKQKLINAEKAAVRRKRTIAIFALIVVACITLAVLAKIVIIPRQKLNKAIKLLETGDYGNAYELFEEIGNDELTASYRYDRAVAMIDSGDYEVAYNLLSGFYYKDSEDLLESIKPQCFPILLSRANKLLKETEDYEAIYQIANFFEEAGKYDYAIRVYQLLNQLLGRYKDSDVKCRNSVRKYINSIFETNHEDEVFIFSKIYYDNYLYKLFLDAISAEGTPDFKELTGALGRALEEDNEYKTAFEVYNGLYSEFFSNDKERCNRAFVSSPYLLDDLREKHVGEGVYIECYYKNDAFVITIHLNDRFGYVQLLGDLGGYRAEELYYNKNINSRETVYVFSVSYSDIINPKYKSFVLECWGYRGVFSSSNFCDCMVDLYGNPINR